MIRTSGQLCVRMTFFLVHQPSASPHSVSASALVGCCSVALSRAWCSPISCQVLSEPVYLFVGAIKNYTSSAMATQQIDGNNMSATSTVNLPAIDDAFIKAWPNGGQAHLTPIFLTQQQQHITQSTKPALLPAPSAFTALLHSLLSSVLPPSPTAWVGMVASFLSELLDRSARSSSNASGSIAQTALVDGLWLICQPHRTPSSHATQGTADGRAKRQVTDGGRLRNVWCV